MCKIPLFKHSSSTIYILCVCVYIQTHKHTSIYICVIYIYLFIFLVRRKRRDGVTAPGIRLLLNNLFLYGFLISSYILYMCSISVGSIVSCVALHIREQKRELNPHPELNVRFFSVLHGLLTFTDPFISLHLHHHSKPYTIHLWIDAERMDGWMDGWMDGSTMYDAGEK